MAARTISLSPSQLEALIVGGCFFGSGGGGTLKSARNLLNHFRVGHYYPSTEVHLVPVEAATEGDSVVVAYMGAPAKIDSAEYPIGPAKAVEKAMQWMAQRGRKLKYIVPPESGALGFLVACLVAAKFGLSVVDGDGAARAVPSLPMLTFAAEGVPPDPAFVVSQGGLAVELDVEAAERGSHQHQTDMSTIVEHMLRPIISEPQFGQFGGLGIWLMNPEQLKQALQIRGTVSRAIDLGRGILDRDIDDSQTLLSFLREKCGLKAFALFDGALHSGSLTSSGGFDLGRIEIKHGSHSALALYQNESLIAWSDGSCQPLAMAPDSIAYFIATGDERVVSNGDLVSADGSILPSFRGAPVTLVGIAAHPALRVTRGKEQEGLILKSFMSQLQAMGYYGKYMPVEELRVDHEGTTGGRR